MDRETLEVLIATERPTRELLLGVIAILFAEGVFEKKHIDAMIKGFHAEARERRDEHGTARIFEAFIDRLREISPAS